MSLLSSVSGGTFTAVKYAISLVEELSFSEFFDEYYRLLRDTPLLALTTDMLSSGKLQRPSGRATLIIAASECYSQHLFCDPKGKPYLLGDLTGELSKKSHLKEAIFNATEFQSGLSFRFPVTQNKKVRNGNGLVSIPYEEAQKLRLGDIVAASSCFPGGFEPLVFPQDFHWDGSVPQAVSNRVGTDIALMDGGVFDNQGIQSLMDADKRLADDLDFIILADVAQDRVPLYEISKTTQRWNFTLGQVHTAAFFLFGACLMTFALMARALFTTPDLNWFHHLFEQLLPALLALVTASVLWQVRSLFRNEVLAKIPKAAVTWDDFASLRISQVLEMNELRLTSLMSLSSDVFMKNMRRLIYEKFFGAAEFKTRRVSCLISKLLRPCDDPLVAPVSAQLKKVLVSAEAVPTRLWWESESPHQQKDLVVAGQFSLCRGLLNYYQRLQEQERVLSPEVEVLRNCLRKDWQILCDTPYQLLETHSAASSSESQRRVSSAHS